VHPRVGLNNVEKILDITGTQTPTSSIIQAVASRCTDCTIPAPWERQSNVSKFDSGEINRKFNSGNACYHSVQKLLSSRLLSKNVKIVTYTTTTLYLTLWKEQTEGLWEQGAEKNALISFFLIGIVGDEVQLGPLGTGATNRPIVPTPSDRDGEIGGMKIGRGNRSTRRKPPPVPLCPPQTPHAAQT
jgi:hypothetical protein